MNTGAYLELSDLPEAFQPCLRFFQHGSLSDIFPHTATGFNAAEVTLNSNGQSPLPLVSA